MRAHSCSLLFLFLVLAALPSYQAFAQSSMLISPAFSVLPATFPAGQPASVVLTVANGDTISNTRIEPGDSFTFSVGPALIGTLSISGPTAVGSASLTAADLGFRIVAPLQNCS
ncbi:MAG TPA: hypothetical protein VEZ90_08930 [Blastocatellia bacterium]|nr:hypothetical protein [Blastocatellia bacterium]